MICKSERNFRNEFEGQFLVTIKQENNTFDENLNPVEVTTKQTSVEISRKRKRKDLGTRLSNKGSDKYKDIEILSNVDESIFKNEFINIPDNNHVPIKIIEVPDHIGEHYEISREDELEYFEELISAENFKRLGPDLIKYFQSIKHKYSVTERFIDWINERKTKSVPVDEKPKLIDFTQKPEFLCTCGIDINRFEVAICQICRTAQHLECMYKDRVRLRDNAHHLCRSCFDRANEELRVKNVCTVPRPVYGPKSVGMKTGPRKRSQHFKNIVIMHPLINEINADNFEIIHIKKA